jgi:hypothetical protein
LQQVIDWFYPSNDRERWDKETNKTTRYIFYNNLIRGGSPHTKNWITVGTDRYQLKDSISKAIALVENLEVLPSLQEI